MGPGLAIQQSCLFGFLSFPNHYPSDRRELHWNLMFRIGSAAFAKKLRQAREPAAGISFLWFLWSTQNVVGSLISSRLKTEDTG